jgi:hypothetical protein
VSAAGRPTFLDRRAGALGLVAVLAGATVAAFRLPYVFAVLLAASGVALLAVAAASARRRTDRALAAASAAWGAPVLERVDEEGGAAWFRDRGFSDVARQRVRRMRVRSVESEDGAVAAVEAFLGNVRSRWRAAVLSVPAPAPGSLCLYPGGASDRRRGRRLGGTVSTGLPIDDRFVAFADDAGSATAGAAAIDAGAVEALFARMRALGARHSPGFALDGARASVLLEGCPPAALEPEGAREAFALLRGCVRA